MKFLCENGVDYDECTNLVETEGELCDCCQSIAYDRYYEYLASGLGFPTLREQQIEAQKLK
jgi:hypothetical protein